MKAGPQHGMPRPGAGASGGARQMSDETLPGPVISMASAGADGLSTRSYAEFIAAYARHDTLAPVRRFGELQVCPFQTQAERIFGTDVLASEVDLLEAHLRLCADILDRIAPMCARKARRWVEAGLFAVGEDGTRLARTPQESKVGKRQARSGKISGKVRRLAARFGITGDSHAFNPQAPGDVLTTRKHRNNYLLNGAILTLKGAAVASEADVGHLLSGGADLATLATLGWHGATIDGVLLAKLSAVQQAQCKVLLNFAAAETVVRSWLAGERPDPQLGLQAVEFWSAVVAWSDSAAVMAAAIHEHCAERGRPPEGALWMADRTAKRNIADTRQAQGGWLRDVPGAAALGGAAIGRAALNILGDPAMLGLAGQFGMVAGLPDVFQGRNEHKWAELTKQQFSWRFEQLAGMEAEVAEDPLHAAVLLSAMMYCDRKIGIADTERLIAIGRILNGIVRGSGGTASLLATLLTIGGVGVAALGKGAVFAVTVGGVLFSALLAYRQHMRAREAHAQKEDERTGRAVKATRDFEALCDSFIEGFEVTRGKGRFVNGDIGYSGKKTTRRGAGGNEMLAWEVMAREVVDGFRDGQPLSFSMQVMLRLGLGVMDADQLEHGVLAKLHAGDEAGAMDAVGRLIRNLLAAPPARTAEAVHPEAFKGVFEAAEANAQLLAGDGRPPDDQVIAALMFGSRKERGLGVDRQAFEKSMQVLAKDVDKRGEKAGADGVFHRMLEFSRRLPPVQTESAAQRHLETWTLAGDRAFEQPGWTHELGMSHHRIWQLLDGATRRPEGSWREQILAALDAGVAKGGADADLPAVRERVKQVLLNDVRALQATGMLSGLAGRVAQELSVVFAPTAATDSQRTPTSGREPPPTRRKTAESVSAPKASVESAMERQLAHWTVLGEGLDGDVRSSWHRIETLLSGAVDASASSWAGQLERHVTDRFGDLPVARQLKIIGGLLDDIDLVARSVQMNRYQKHLAGELREQWRNAHAVLLELSQSEDSSTISG